MRIKRYFSKKKTKKKAKLIWVWTGESKTCENNEFLYHYKQTTINKIMFMFIPFHPIQIILNKKK